MQSSKPNFVETLLVTTITIGSILGGMGGLKTLLTPTTQPIATYNIHNESTTTTTCFLNLWSCK